MIRQALLALAALIPLLGCPAGATGPSWTKVTDLPRDLKVTSIVPTGPSEVVVFGYRNEGGSMPQFRSPLIVRWDGAALSTSRDGGRGWIQAADGSGDAVWAVHAVLQDDGEGSDYALIVSADRGRTWSEGRPIPASSLTDVAVQDGSCGWVLGVGALLRSCDAGATWQPVEATGARTGVGEPMSASADGALVLGGKSAQRTTDAGLTWSDLTEERIAATDGHRVVSRDSPGSRVGRINGGSVAWTGRLDGDLLPTAVASGGSSVLVEASPLGSRVGSGVLLLRSTDGGATFEERLLRGSSDSAYVALAGPDAAWRVDLGRRLLHGAWP